jgi:hypothetical protein
MKKVLVLMTAALLVTGVTFADNGKKKKCAKGKTCCSKDAKGGKSCCKKKAKETTAKL